MTEPFRDGPVVKSNSSLTELLNQCCFDKIYDYDRSFLSSVLHSSASFSLRLLLICIVIFWLKILSFIPEQKSNSSKFKAMSIMYDWKENETMKIFSVIVEVAQETFLKCFFIELRIYVCSFGIKIKALLSHSWLASS